MFKSYYARAQHDWTLTPTIINHFNAGFSRSDVQNRNFTRGIPASSLGLAPERHAELWAPARRVPRLRQRGDLDRSSRLSARRIHLLRQPSRRQLGPPERLRDDHPRPAHVEVWWLKWRNQQLNNAAHFDIGGNFNFRSNQTGNTNDFNQGWPIASLITGRPEFSFNSNQTIDPALRFLSYAFFAQDDCKVTSALNCEPWHPVRLRAPTRRGARLLPRLRPGHGESVGRRATRSGSWSDRAEWSARRPTSDS